MPVVSVRIPQMGEGLQEALLVEFLKKPGDTVKRDEPIYVMETDKATTDVESPYDGVLVEWTAETGTVLPIGNEVGKMEVAAGVKEMAAGHGPPGEVKSENGGADMASSGSQIEKSDDKATTRDDVTIPPRTRKYLKEKNLIDQVGEIPVVGKKMMPDDVDRYLQSSPVDSSTAYALQDTDDYSESELPKNQIGLNFRLKRGTSECVPVTVMQTVSWEAIHAARQELKKNSEIKVPSGFGMMLWCVAETAKHHQRFRSSLFSEGRYLRTYHHVNLGVAVGLPEDQLVTAVLEKADKLTRSEFFATLKDRIEIARQGKDQANSSVSISVSNIGSAGMRWGIPAIVSPAMATLALGEIFDQPIPNGDTFKFQKSAELTLSFDHRLLNGMGAADFMNELKERIESYH